MGYVRIDNPGNNWFKKAPGIGSKKGYGNNKNYRKNSIDILSYQPVIKFSQKIKNYQATKSK